MPDHFERLPWLEPGDHLDQAAFHTRYQAMPPDIKAELVEGMVHIPAALKREHGRHHGLVIHWLYAYEDHTSGVEVYDNATTIMGEQSEPQPDASLIILPSRGGQIRFTDDDFLQGAAELVVEIASSTESIDLHAKKRDYERGGVREYLVVALRQRQVFWFVSRDLKFHPLAEEADGTLRSTVFPGLWLDPAALLELHSTRVIDVLKQGVATAEHAAFVQRLADPTAE